MSESSTLNDPIKIPNECYECGGEVATKRENGVAWSECESCGRVYAMEKRK